MFPDEIYIRNGRVTVEDSNPFDFESYNGSPTRRYSIPAVSLYKDGTVFLLNRACLEIYKIEEKYNYVLLGFDREKKQIGFKFIKHDCIGASKLLHDVRKQKSLITVKHFLTSYCGIQTLGSGKFPLKKVPDTEDIFYIDLTDITFLDSIEEEGDG